MEVRTPSSRFILAALATLALGACAATPPAGPEVTALPPAGKDFVQFQREDRACQQAAAAAVPPNLFWPEAQRLYDRTYSQCMAAAGNAIQQPPEVITIPVPMFYGPTWPYGRAGIWVW